MKDKVIVITGSSSGIGKYLSEYFSLNNNVIGLCRSGGENAIVCDISSNSDLDNAVEQIKRKYGKVDMLINNAGYGLTGACEMLSDEEINSYIESGEPMDKAGAYGIQEKGSVFVTGIRGDYFNVMGLPICEITEVAKKEFGIHLTNFKK